MRLATCSLRDKQISPLPVDVRQTETHPSKLMESLPAQQGGLLKYTIGATGNQKPSGIVQWGADKSGVDSPVGIKSLGIMILGGLLCTSEALGRLETIPGSRFTTARGAALGDAFLPLSEDGSALFYNPASIGKVRRPMFEPLNFSIGVNTEYLSMVDRNFYRVTSLQSYAPSISGKEGKNPGAAFQIFPNFVLRGLAFGILMSSDFEARATGGSIRYRSRYQFIPTIGGALRLASGVVRLGYSLQWVNLASGDVTTSLTSSPLGWNQQLQQGAGLSHNLGFAITIPVAYLPALNVVARNVLGARYTLSSIVPLARNTSGSPATEEMSIDASVSVQPKVGRGASFNLVLEYRDVTNRSGISVLGRAVLGVEFSFRDLFFIRGGWGSGYPSAGIGLKRKTAEFGLAWYSEETGAAYHSERDIRYLLHYQIRAF